MYKVVEIHTKGTLINYRYLIVTYFLHNILLNDCIKIYFIYVVSACSYVCNNMTVHNAIS